MLFCADVGLPAQDWTDSAHCPGRVIDPCPRWLPAIFRSLSVASRKQWEEKALFREMKDIFLFDIIPFDSNIS